MSLEGFEHRKVYRRQGDVELKEIVVSINRVTKVTKGGRRFRFAALVVVGDGEGIVGYGLGKANEVMNAVNKAINNARKNLYKVSVVNGTIPHEIEEKYGASLVFMRPAAPGTGIIAGGTMRMLFSVAGVRDVLAKIKGSTTPHNVLKATMKALLKMRDAHQVAKERGVPLQKVFNG